MAARKKTTTKKKTKVGKTIAKVRKNTKAMKKSGGLKGNRGVTKQELSSASRKLARSMHPKAKKKKNETAKQKANRKSYNKARKKQIRSAGRGHSGDAKGKARKFLH